MSYEVQTPSKVVGIMICESSVLFKRFVRMHYLDAEVSSPRSAYFNFYE
jgi:hypothetical protein